MVSDQSLVFVYGTLKRNFPLHSHLGNSEFLGDAKTERDYFLVDCGHYPGLRQASNQHVAASIAGEVFQVDAETLAVLDEVEAVAEGLYLRQHIRLLDTFGHQKVWAWFYVSDRFDHRIIGDRWV